MLDRHALLAALVAFDVFQICEFPRWVLELPQPAKLSSAQERELFMKFKRKTLGW